MAGLQNSVLGKKKTDTVPWGCQGGSGELRAGGICTVLRFCLLKQTQWDKTCSLVPFTKMHPVDIPKK